MKLNDRDRLVLDLLGWDPLSNAEVAQALGIDRAVAHRALSKLQKGGLVKNLKTDQASLEGWFSTPGRYVLTGEPPVIDPGWLVWNDQLIAKTVAQIVATEGFDTLPILADMLEDAGCTDVALLNHLRQEQPHSTRCWALRLLATR
jgi:hypothetical protein